MHLKDAGYRLNRIEVERKGRWTSYIRTISMVGMLTLLALPPTAVTLGWLDNRTPGLAATTVAGIALILETVVLGAIVVCAYRAHELVRSSRAPAPFSTISRIVLWFVAAMVLVRMGESVLMWFFAEGLPLDESVDGRAVTLWPIVAGVAGGAVLALISSPGFWWRREGDRHAVRRFSSPSRSWAQRLSRLDDLDSALKRWRGVLVATEQELANPPSPSGIIICCSGGGIRSASFCLGGLQTLTKWGLYQQARAVVGVSGGGYIASAYHVVRWRSDSGWEEQRPDAFDSRSPEMTWLRRHTRYLMESAKVATLGFLSLLYGISVNLLWVTLVVAAVAGWMALFLMMSGGLRGLDTATVVGGSYTGDWTWVGWVWLIGALGLTIFVLERFVERYFTLTHAVREKSRSTAVLLLWAGIGTTILLLGIPALIEAVHNWAVRSDSVLAGLAHQLGLVSTEACNARLPGADACGIASTTDAETAPPSPVALPASFATVVVALVAVVKAAQSTVSAGGKTATTKVLIKFWVRVRDSIVPWAAVVVVSIVVLTLELRWISALVRDPGPLSAWNYAAGFAAVLLVLRIFTDANRTSLHHFYRERLAYAYLVRRVGQRAVPLRYRETLRFSESVPPTKRGPELVACAIANVSDPEYVPTERHCTPFVFDARGIGLTDEALPSGPNLTASVIYERAADERAREATVAAAMAMSGAAFSPLVGRQNVRVGPYRAILALSNARLGVWLPNPLWVDDVTQTRVMIQRRLGADAKRAYDVLTEEDRTALAESLKPTDARWFESWRGSTEPAKQGPDGDATAQITPHHGAGPSVSDKVRWSVKLASICREVCGKPGPFRFAKEAFGKTSVLDRKLYVTDGGHYDNLGMVEALRRRPAEVFVLDASSDPEDSFQALGDAIATARIDLGVEVDVELTKLVRGEDKYAKAAWTSGTATYPDGKTAKVHLVKVLMLDALPWDTVSYSRGHPEFPRTSTGNQLYGEFDLEAYRILGRELTERLLKTRDEAANPSETGQPQAERPVVPQVTNQPLTAANGGQTAEDGDSATPVLVETLRAASRWRVMWKELKDEISAAQHEGHERGTTRANNSQATSEQGASTHQPTDSQPI